MSLIFSAFQLKNHTGLAHVDRRFQAIENHYKSNKSPNIKFIRWYNEEKRIGFHAIYQSFDNEKIERCVEDENSITAYTSYPFGYSKVLGDVPVKQIANLLADKLKSDPDQMRYMHPPFTLVDISKCSGDIRVYNDLVGYDRVFRLDCKNGFCVSNRSLPPFFITLTTPKLSDIGWASEQLSGYMYGAHTAFGQLQKNPPGSKITISANKYSIEHSDLIYDWFTKPPGNTIEGLDRLAREIHAIGEYRDVDVGLTGGRDSRASAAFAFHTFGYEARARTSYPPILERDLASQIAAATSDFDRFENPNHAVRRNGSTIWRAIERKKPRRQSLLQRADDWAYILEGSGTASALYNTCNAQSAFVPRSYSDPSIPGIGGELAKAYSYSSQQVSGVYATDFGRWNKEVLSVPIWKRLIEYIPTAKSKIYFVDEDYWRTLEDYHVSELLKAHDNGLTGYQFLDFWLLTGRFAGAHNPGYFGSLIMPFFTPEFIQSGAQDSLRRKFHAQLSKDIVDYYQPQWSSVPYFDEIQNKVPFEKVKYFREEEFLWSGPNASEFWNVLRDSPALDNPFDRKKIISHFEHLNTNDALAGVSNVKAHSLIYRHAVFNLCNQVSQEIEKIRSVRLRRWK